VQVGDHADGISRLGKKERRVSGGIEAHLASVRGVVPPDTVDPPKRKKLRRADDRESGDRRWCDDIIGHRVVCCRTVDEKARVLKNSL